MRDRKIDVMKGLAIILVVIGHSGFRFTQFIYLFHMALFIMLSGFFFKMDNVGVADIRKAGISKIKGLWWPSFLWSTVFILLNNIFISINFYSLDSQYILGNRIDAHHYYGVSETIKEIIKAVFMIGRTEMGGTFWFFATLFGISILCIIINFLMSFFISNNKWKIIVHLIIAVVFLVMGWICSDVYNVKHITIPVILSCYILYILGFIFNYHKLVNKNNLVCACISFLILVCSYIWGYNIHLGRNIYGNPAYMLLVSVSGWILTEYIALKISRLRITGIFEYVGRNSLAIMIHHFWCMKIVHLLQIRIYGYPSEYLAAFPYLNSKGLWWIVYSIVGVSFPLGINYLCIKSKELLIGKVRGI